ncbi:MAG: hypothetical protein ACMXYF_02800 [Candidatus Woesearchaeota archaeon]
MKWRVWLLLVLVIISLVVIQFQPWRDGVIIQEVVQNTPAQVAGMSADTDRFPTLRERIVEVNGEPIKTVRDFYRANLSGDSIIITQQQRFLLWPFSQEQVYYLENDGDDAGIRVSFAPTSNIRFGLDIQGGSRLVLEPVRILDAEEFSTLRDSIERRLNVYGLSDITVRQVTDSFLGDVSQFIVIEIAGQSPDEVEQLVTQQGRFEAKILNQTIFTGSDITVITSSQQGGITQCSQANGEFVCRYNFPIQLSLQAARAQADATRELDVVGDSLSAPIQLFLDDVLVDELSISADLQGRVTQSISISGSGVGPGRVSAQENALSRMREIQTLLRSGDLPARLEVVRKDTISPLLGQEFIANAFLVALVAAIAVSTFVYIRYRTFKVVIPMLLTAFAEVILLLFLASITPFVNIDLAAIGSIIIMLGTGVDHQIIITDELLSKNRGHLSWRGRLKKALNLIFTSYATTVFAMIAILIFGGGIGILNAFAITTIVGLSIGVFIARPAYAVIIESLLKKHYK